MKTGENWEKDKKEVVYYVTADRTTLTELR